MKKSFVNLLTFVFVIQLIFICDYAIAGDDDLEKIRKAIKEKELIWTAEENWITRLSPEERKDLLGAIIDPSDSKLAPLISLPPVESLPPVFDWRNNNGNWITPVKNQGNCGSCWDFSAVAQVEAWWKIYNSNLDSMIDLSEQFILSCGNAGSCAGGSCAEALEFVKNVGVPSEACFPYYADDTVPCSDACSDWVNEAEKIPGWGWITMNEAIINNIKNAVFIHPLSTYFTVYTDFLYYSGGVYQYAWGQEEGGHLVLIVGWDDTEQSWICKNSWGENWGESGFFRIKWGECLIGTWSPFIWNELVGDSVISVSPQQFDLSLEKGDTTIQELILTNQGQRTLEYSATDFSSIVLFHPDVFFAWDSLSWWCGDTLISGYYNDCLQYLETPVLDLSNTSIPHLFWEGFWALEAPSSYPPYDGWDGCNVWVSVDGGNNFEVAYPTSPQYNCSHLYSFSNPSGWNLGIIPGWGGSNGVWTQVEFDLSSYKSDSVIIRFAFASDEMYCTLDDPSLYGFFVDDIKISDGGTIIFEDDGNDISSMQKIGYGRLIADWIEISNSVGQIPANDSIVIDVKFDARNIITGDYNGSIVIISNDTVLSRIEIPIHLEVTDPVGINDITNMIPDRFKLEQNYPNPFNPTTTIIYGIRERTTVELKIFDVLGREVETIVNSEQDAGYYEVAFNASRLASGIYFYRLKAGSFVETKKMVLMK